MTVLSRPAVSFIDSKCHIVAHSLIDPKCNRAAAKMFLIVFKNSIKVYASLYIVYKY